MRPTKIFFVAALHIIWREKKRKTSFRGLFSRRAFVYVFFLQRRKKISTFKKVVVLHRESSQLHYNIETGLIKTDKDLERVTQKCRSSKVLFARVYFIIWETSLPLMSPRLRPRNKSAFAPQVCLFSEKNIVKEREQKSREQRMYRRDSSENERQREERGGRESRRGRW